MIYELMHKDILVAEIEIGDQGNLKKLISICNRDHFPLGTAPKAGSTDPSGLARWWNNRRIPISRNDLENIRGIVLPEAATPGMILLACQGLSLSDCYWIREKGSDDSFEKLNFFDNSFSFDFGDLLVGKQKGDIRLVASPDGTSEGNLKKRWKIIDGKRVLLKSGTPPYRYEIYHEVIASVIMRHLNVSHVDYYLIEDGNELYCACDDFVGYSQDFVTAYMIHEGNKKRNDESEYEFMIRCYEGLGIKQARNVINTMLLVDYLLGNEDRHLNNFGLIRDAKTLEFMGPAPIFDTGSSLGFEMADETLMAAPPIKWKPFQTNARPSQLDYIDDLPSGIRMDALLSIPQVVSVFCKQLPPSFSKKRSKAIAHFISKRVSDVVKKFNLESISIADAMTKTQRRILEYIHSIGGTLHSAQEASLALAIPKITVIRNVKILADQGYIIRVGSRKTGFWKMMD